MNPRLETINGKLCIMLEKPIPLTKEAKFPCIVRLIQDDSPMGRYNKWNWEGLTELTHIRELIGLPDDTIPCIECDDDEHISHYEILGYPVEEGSHWWALYHMQSGNAVCHTKAPSIKYSMPTHYVKRKVRENCTDDMSIQVWLSGADKDGWQLYKEPEPQYKVGDWVTDGVIKGKITSLTDDLAWVKTEFYEYRMSLRNLTPISPSEVVIDFGSFSGWIKRASNYNIEVYSRGNCWLANLRFDMLDTQTRSLVEDLLKAQEEE